MNTLEIDEDIKMVNKRLLFYNSEVNRESSVRIKILSIHKKFKKGLNMLF